MKITSKVALAMVTAMAFAAPVFAGDSEQPVADSVITAKVKASLAKDSATSAKDIHVETKNGVVYLTGMAASEAEKEKASKDAQLVNGVVSVKNDLKLHQ